MTRGIVCALFVLALCAGVLGQSGTDVTVRLSGDFGILGDPAPSTTADIIGIESGTVYMLKFYDGGPSLPLGGWYTACGITFEGFPFFGSSVDITGPLFVVGDTTDNSVGIYYIDGFVDDTNDDGDSDAAKAAGYDASLWVPATSTEAIRLGVTTSVRQAFMNGTYEYEGYGYGYNYGISYDYDYDYEEGYDEGYDSYNEGYDFPFEDYYSDDYFPADYGYWEPYGGYAGTDGENYGFGEDDGPGFDYGGGGGYDSDFRDGPPPAYADYAPGFYYWNYAIPESWLFEIIEDTPQTDALICGYHNETTGEGRRFYIKTIEFVLNDGDLNWVENTTATELLGCGLCKFGSRLTVGEQFIASTCNMPCKQNRVATEDGGLAVVPGAVACTMVCVLPLGTMNDNRGYRLALPSYLKPFKVLESQVNRFYTALDAYSTFMVNAGCFLEQKATGFNQNIGGFSPMIQLCKMNPRGRVLEKSCDRGPVLVLQDEKLNVCPTSVALYGENKVAKFIALGFSNLETVYLFKMNNSLPFTSQFLRTYQKITLDETQKTSLFGHSVSFSTDDSTFEGTDDSVSAPSRVTLAIGAFGDVNEGAGATFVYSEIQEGERPPEDCPTENDNCFFQLTPGTMSSYNYPVRYDFGFATEMDYNSVAIVTVDIASGFWEFSSYTECDLGEQWIGDQCVPCPAGQYSNTESYDPCRLCPEGTFQPRRGQVSPGACIPCNRAEFCPMGAKVPIDQRYADDELYAINDPDPKASPALHFETTFFFSVVPPALILGAILIIFFLPFAISCLYRFKIFRSFRSFVCLFNLIDDKENDLLSAFFTVWLIISTVFLVVFAILFATKVNDSLTTSLKTFDDVTDLESASDLTIIDEVPFQVSIAYINLADYISCDDKSFDLTIDGCFDDYERCDPLVHYKQSRIGETEARVCNVTFGFREKTQLDRFSRFTLTTKVDRFYASQVWYKVSTLNDDDTDIEGNSYVSGSVQPLPDAVLRGEGKASVLSTLTPLMNCRSNTLNWITFLLVTSESECEFDTQGSLKSFSHLANVTQDASEPDFYVPNREFPNLEGYAFTVEIEKGNYYHLKAQGNYVTNAQIFILVVLLIFGFWWGVLQLTKFIIDRCIYISKTSCETVA